MTRRIKLEDDYRELQLGVGASLEEVKSAYRELAMFWHPDQFHDRPGRLARAHEKMTRINLAYERIRKELAHQARSRLSTARTKSPSPHSRTGHRPSTAWTNSLGMKFVSVPGTSVLFCVWETRVQDYATYAQAAPGVDASWKNPGFSQTGTHPVVKVSWEDAQGFCRWITQKERQEGKVPAVAQYRLPSDSEWSWAVGIGDRERDGTPRDKGKRLKDLYPWGTAWPPPQGAGNYDPCLGTDSFDYTSPAGSFEPNLQGLFDLGGNVWEWCEDFLNGTSGVRVLRGGSWNFSGPDHLLSSYRNGVAADARSSGIGFRCVLDGMAI
ncbi:MAG TPA: SUMF1/EgtB/PvdO family nonheme iron enzyme [Verrucomicrobiae bacterium]|nr:SUMF1/EgtB/PvdO family nonheme iron enzyme [Verrucomicrobiae bacterium]